MIEIIIAIQILNVPQSIQKNIICLTLDSVILKTLLNIRW